MIGRKERKAFAKDGFQTVVLPLGGLDLALEELFITVLLQDSQVGDIELNDLSTEILNVLCVVIKLSFGCGRHKKKPFRRDGNSELSLVPAVP